MTRVRTGGCLCGRVRFRLTGEPFQVGICHCAECRKETGTVMMAYAKWPIHAFAMTGEFRTHSGRSFCPECGSRLFNLHDEDVEVKLGSLDEAPADLVPTQEGWIKRREPWLTAISGASQSSEDPPS